jgi:hypothetical protein
MFKNLPKIELLYRRSQESGVRSQESGVRSQESGVRRIKKSKEERRRKKKKEEERRRKLSTACCLRQGNMWILHKRINNFVNISRIKHKIFVKLTRKLEVE